MTAAAVTPPRNDTWTHKAARQLVRPMLGTWVRPNHLTLARGATGLLACVLLAVGRRDLDLWAGALWLVSCFLDRADGELARIGDMRSRQGHLYDYYADMAVNSAFFLAAGFNLRNSPLAGWAILLGVVACVAMLVVLWVSELYEDATGPGSKAWHGRWGFDPDDALYLLGVVIWLRWLPPVLVVGAVSTSVIAVVFSLRALTARRLVRQTQNAASG